MSNVGQQTVEAIKALAANPTVKSKLINILTSKKPPGWGNRSVSSYYKRVYALELKELVDKQMETKEDIVYFYNAWCEGELAINKNTLYNRVWQSKRYLLDNMNEDGKYTQWDEDTKCEKREGLGVVIYYSNDKADGTRRPQLVSSRSNIPEWRRQLELWLESTNDEPFVKERLALTEDEVKQLNESLSQVSGIAFDVTFSSIKVIRME